MIFKTSTLVDTQQIELCELQQESDAPAHSSSTSPDELNSIC